MNLYHAESVTNILLSAKKILQQPIPIKMEEVIPQKEVIQHRDQDLWDDLYADLMTLDKLRLDVNPYKIDLVENGCCSCQFQRNRRLCDFRTGKVDIAKNGCDSTSANVTPSINVTPTQHSVIPNNNYSTQKRGYEHLDEDINKNISNLVLKKSRKNTLNDNQNKNLILQKSQKNTPIENQKRNSNYSSNVIRCKKAAEYGNLEALILARKNGCDWDEDTCSHAAKNGHLIVLIWAHQNECNWDSNTCTFAAKNGHLATLKWARENGCDWNSNTCAYAALNGHLEVLKWARQNGCPWDEFTCAQAASNGHFETLIWAHQNGCPWNEYTCAYAQMNGHVDILRWAIHNGCPWDINLCKQLAPKNYL